MPSEGIKAHTNYSRLEELSDDILEKIHTFLTFKDRIRLSRSSPVIRKDLIRVPVDMSQIHMVYENLVNFLKLNPNINPIGLNIQVTEKTKDLKEILPFLRKIHILSIGGINRSNIDYSALLECKNLEIFKIPTQGSRFNFNFDNLANSKLIEIDISNRMDSIDIGRFIHLNKLTIRSYKSDIVRLDLSNNHSLTALDLEGLPNLTNINLSNNILSYVKLSNIKHLDMSFLNSCRSLNMLKYYNGGASIDLSLLSLCSELREIILSGCEIIGDLISNTKLDNPSFIGVTLYNGLLPLFPANLTSFQIIDGFIENISLVGLGICSNLELLRINLGNCSIDLEEIKYCTKLKYLYLDAREINNINILFNFSKLTSLIIKSSSMKNISKLKYLPNLRDLELDILDLIDLSFLKKCTSLISIQLSSKLLQDLSGIEHCSNLEELFLTNCKRLRDISSVMKLINLVDFIIIGSNSVDKESRNLFTKHTGIEILSNLENYRRSVK